MKKPSSTKNQSWNKPGRHFQIGLIVSLSLALFAFNFTSHYEVGQLIVAHETEDEIVFIDEITAHKQRKEFKEEPPKPEKGKLVISNEPIPEPEPEPIVVPKPDSTPVINPTKLQVLVEPEDTFVGPPDPFMVVEQMPEFPGGAGAMMQFIGKNLQYPPIAVENDITGRVTVSFIVTANGDITDIKVLRDIGGGCGAEAVRIVEMMPKWIPGKQRNKAVPVIFNLPIKFELN